MKILAGFQLDIWGPVHPSGTIELLIFGSGKELDVKVTNITFQNAIYNMIIPKEKVNEKISSTLAGVLNQAISDALKNIPLQEKRISSVEILQID